MQELLLLLILVRSKQQGNQLITARHDTTCYLLNWIKNGPVVTINEMMMLIKGDNRREERERWEWLLQQKWEGNVEEEGNGGTSWSRWLKPLRERRKRRGVGKEQERKRGCIPSSFLCFTPVVLWREYCSYRRVASTLVKAALFLPCSLPTPLLFLRSLGSFSHSDQLGISSREEWRRKLPLQEKVSLFLVGLREALNHFPTTVTTWLLRLGNNHWLLLSEKSFLLCPLTLKRITSSPPSQLAAIIGMNGMK